MRHQLTRIKRMFLVSLPVSFLIRKSKQISLPGFQGIPLFDVIRFFFLQARKTGFTERASSVAYNFVMAIPPAVIFLFTLIPYIPISEEFLSQMFGLIKDVVPGEENNQRLIGFLEDILQKTQNRFIVARFCAGNVLLFKCHHGCNAIIR
ncbi:MAG: YihY/virulence factor BrkB family protein [Chitinophagaceae bacterium]|nr:YihY/virulence factor BrkB family protein [Chitinophagaceae bacterium]